MEDSFTKEKTTVGIWSNPNKDVTLSVTTLSTTMDTPTTLDPNIDARK